MGRSPPTPSRGRRPRAPDEGRCRADPHCTHGGRPGRVHHHVHTVAGCTRAGGEVHDRPVGTEIGAGRDAPEPAGRVPCRGTGASRTVEAPVRPVDRVAGRAPDSGGEDAGAARAASPERSGRHGDPAPAVRVGTGRDVRGRRELVGGRGALQRRPRDHPFQLGRLRRPAIRPAGAMATEDEQIMVAERIQYDPPDQNGCRGW